MVKLLEKQGFKITRVKGSHYFLKNENRNFVTTVPVHNDEDLGIGMIKDILDDIEMSRGEYERLTKSRKK